MATNNFKSAQRRYLRVFAPTMIFFCVLCFAGPMLFVTTDSPPKSILALVAIMTGAPIGIVFWLMGRHLKETDEYTRKIQVDAMLVAGGITFTAAVIWGFLELYHAVPRLAFFPSMLMVGPIFFSVWGITYAIQGLKGR